MLQSFIRLIYLIFSVVLFSLFSNVSNALGDEGSLVADINNRKIISFSLPLKGLNSLRSANFIKGADLFRQEWSEYVGDPKVSRTGSNFFGLGPTFSAKSCADCHERAGRGSPPLKLGERLKALVMKVGTINGDVIRQPQPHPAYGEQINSMAVKGVPAEGKVFVEYYSEEGRYGDGSTFRLRRPSYVFYDLKFGQLDQSTIISPRVPPIVAGLGILESISDKDILSLADINDADLDGISGKPNFVWSVSQNIEKLGRFGWKAEAVTLYEQVAQAAHRDLGLTSTLHPDQACPPVQKLCADATIVSPKVEISDDRLRVITEYLRYLAPPDRLTNENKQVKRGERIFNDIGCSKCHAPLIKLGFSRLERKDYSGVEPYTDLLLHDMGPDLADVNPNLGGNGREWRTPPLWGLGSIKLVNHHEFLMHDGRARGIAEAILWHGGEAKISREKFRLMEASGREDLLKFLGSL